MKPASGLGVRVVPVATWTGLHSMEGSSSCSNLRWGGLLCSPLSPFLFTACLHANVQVAEMSADLDRFDRAQSIYEDVARASVENNLLKYSAKGYLLQVCALGLQMGAASVSGALPWRLNGTHR